MKTEYGALELKNQVGERENSGGDTGQITNTECTCIFVNGGKDLPSAYLKGGKSISKSILFFSPKNM